MEKFSRRGFIGALVAAAAGSELILKATPREVAMFTRKDPVHVAKPVEQPVQRFAASGEIVFNYKGEPIGIVRSARTVTSIEDVTAFGFYYGMHRARLLSVEYEVVSFGPVEVRI